MALGPDVLAGKGAAATNPGTPFLITPHDSNDLAYVTRMITINVPSGSYPWRISRVYSTDTAATGITGTR